LIRDTYISLLGLLLHRFMSPGTGTHDGKLSVRLLGHLPIARKSTRNRGLAYAFRVRRPCLKDDPWKRVKGLLLGHVKVTAAGNRLFVEAVLYRYGTEIPWRDLPERFGAFRVVHNPALTGASLGSGERLFRRVAQDAANEWIILIPPSFVLTSTVTRPSRRRLKYTKSSCSLISARPGQRRYERREIWRKIKVKGKTGTAPSNCM
jgi:hypothetical protein